MPTLGFVTRSSRAGLNYDAVSWDLMLGAAYTRDKWTYTLGGVYLNSASTDNPTEWGQDNTATFVNLGIYRKMPEIYRNVEFYAGLGRVIYGRQGPAPISMPNNIAFNVKVDAAYVTKQLADIAKNQDLSRYIL